MLTTYNFQEIKMGGCRVNYVCPDCKKKRVKTVSRSYYRNGLHDESATRQKLGEQIQNECADLRAEKVPCQKCKDAAIDAQREAQRAKRLAEATR